MSKSSIHFNVVKANSEHHNLRKSSLDYVHEELAGDNRTWSSSSIQDKEKEVARHCKNVTGRKMQKNAEPIREAVINLLPRHTIEDLQNVAKELRERFKIDCFQIHIHRDEGLKDKESGKIKINHHAHMVFDWQDKETGKTVKLNPVALSQIQTLVATELGMDRGELRENSNRERLESVEYKRQEEEIKLNKTVAYNHELHQQNVELEQKKNEVIRRIREFTEEGNRLDEGNSHQEREVSAEVIEIINKPYPSTGELTRLDENSLIDAIYILEKQIRTAEEEIDNHQG